ncbi:MAG: extracellular solute-binding protein [Ruminococcaceae bacterium]|nr:extracellular solute-binding protein [Oscillospiraceae bacterium]
MKQIISKTLKTSLLFILSATLLASCAEPVTLIDFIGDASEEKLDFNGYVFTIKTAWENFWNPLASDELEDNVALSAKQDAIIKHNKTVMEKYNCTITSVTSVWDFATNVLAEIGSGASKYSMFDSASMFSYNAMKSGLLHPWDYSGIDLTDYEKYGTEQYLKGAEVDGLHYGIWAYKWEAEIEYRGMVIVNNNLLKNYIDVNVHELKESGKWTFDGFKTVLEACTVNIGADPIYSLSCYDIQMFALCSMLANGGSLIEYNEAKGKYEMGLLSAKSREGLEYAQDLYNSDLVQIDDTQMGTFIEAQKAAFALCESWNLTYALKEMDNLDVITFPYGPSAEYGKTVSAYRSNQIRYLSTPITEDIEQLGKFVNVWFEELEDMPKENIIDEYKTIRFFNDESMNENTFMADFAIYDYGTAINEVYSSNVVSALTLIVSSNAGVTESVASQQAIIQAEIDKNLNN